MAAALSAPAVAEAPRLSLPIRCEPGKTCFVQNYVDVDAGPGAQDYTCGSATYDGHKGTDFRVLSAAAARSGFDVLAAADGIVRGVRDGVDDAFVTSDNKANIAGRECGNGVVLTHPDGWETQYCHMLKGSVTVRTGDRIARGQTLGRVGYSGLVEFAHVHLEVRHDGKPVDPFTGRSATEACMLEAASGTGLWAEEAARAFPYATAEILGAGFTSDPNSTETLETDDALPQPSATSAALILYLRAANLKAGDRARLKVSGPDGVLVEHTTEPMPRTKATYRAFGGKKLKAERWPAGTYTGTAEIIRDGKVLASRSVELTLD